jgi:cell wall-associated NlpC family hydrolase
LNRLLADRAALQKSAELARVQLLLFGVPTPDSIRSRIRWGAIAGGIALLFLASLSPARARTRRLHPPKPVEVILQPFLLARSVAHAVADPIALKAPRAIATVATAPIRITSTHRPEIPRAETLAYLIVRPQKPVEPDPGQAEEEGADFAGEANGDSGDEGNGVQGFETEPEGFGKGPTVAGSRAVLRNGIAYAPTRAPQSVKTAIWAANSLRRKPYLWGGGHGSFFDRGYDCSGTVSFALRGAGAIDVPLGSSELMRYGKRGRGRWFTIYARPGHTFALIAGLRLDTTDFRNGGNIGPRWQAEMRDTRGYFARHPAGM